MGPLRAVYMTKPACRASCCRCHDEPIGFIRRDEEFHQIHIVLKYIFDVNAVTRNDTDVLLPTLGMIEVNVQPSPAHYHNVDRLET